MLRELILDADALDRLYPCHLVLDSEARVVGAGRVLRRLLPELAATPPLHDVFALERPRGVADFGSLCRARDSTFLLNARSRSDVRLKGELFPVPDAGCAVLFTVLWFTDGSVLDTLDLAIDDFALSDASSDFVFLIETQAALLRDARLSAERLRAARDEALSASRLKGDFLATMSHEIRTPMNGILGMTGLLLDSRLDEEQQLYARSIYQSAEALLTVINDILDFSKLEAGKLSLEAVDFDLAAVITSVTDLLGPRARAKGLDLGVFVAPEVPPWLCGDSGRLRQILLNLVGNAVKFTERGGVAVEVTRLGAQEDGSIELRFRIIDSGIGIPADAQTTLFEKFTQADSSMTRRFGGTGLGLAISRQLAELMGGDIGVESAPGGGSTFWFTARFGVAAERAAAEPPSAQSLARLRGLRILVVDDNAVNRLIFQKQLESWGLTVQAVEDGAAALDALEHALQVGQPFALALIDRSMPEMDGEELGRRIRENAAFAATPLVLATSFGERAEISAEPALFAARLCKPVLQPQLLTCLLTVLGIPAAPAEPEAGATAPLPDLKAFGGRPLRLLLAEDNQVNQLLAIAMLQKAGHRVDIANNGIEAVEAVLNRPYDLVLMDVQMPEMDGIQATRRIRTMPGPKGRIPIIAVTANAMRGDRERYLQAGMDDYVAKPIDRTQLFEVIRRWSGDNDAVVSSDAAALMPAATAEPVTADPNTEAMLAEMLDSLDMLAPAGPEDAR